MKKYLLIIVLGVLFYGCGPSSEVQKTNGLFHLKNEQIGIAINTDLQGIVYKNPEMEKTRILFEEPVFAIVSENNEINFTIDKVLHNQTESIKGQPHLFRILASDNQNSGIVMEIILIVPEINKNVLMTQVTLTNKSGHHVQVDKLICHRYTLESQDGDTRQGEAPFWAFCGGTYPERFDWIEPMQEGFYRQNDMVIQEDNNYSGGNPYTGIWNPQFGIGIMSLETYQVPLKFPVQSEQEGLVKISIEEPIGKMLSPGATWTSTRHAVLVHEGDVGNGLAIWSELLNQQGLELPQSPESCFESVWCGWGYEDDYTSAELISTIPVAMELGMKWVVVDAGWYDRNTFWELHPGKYPQKDASMRAFTDSVKALGMRPKLWFIPSTAPYGWPEGRYGKKGELILPDENMLLLNKENESVDLTWFGVSLLCPAFEPVVEANRAFVRKAMTDWGYDGFKIDGEYLNRFPPCYNVAHGHKDSLESTYAGSQLLKAMYEEAITIVPDAVFEICACGTNYSIYNMVAQNQVVSSDPLSSWQIRHRGKIYHALTGSDMAYYGDHVELSDGGEDFASTIGVGGVPGTKFTILETREFVEGSKLLTNRKKKIWKKYLNAYNKERIAQGKYINLYDICYDKPEIHLIQKKEDLYYGIFSEGKFKGEVQLKGLSPGRKYKVVDYINDEVIASSIGFDRNQILVEFKDHLLVKVSAID